VPRPPAWRPSRTSQSVRCHDRRRRYRERARWARATSPPIRRPLPHRQVAPARTPTAAIHGPWTLGKPAARDRWVGSDLAPASPVRRRVEVGASLLSLTPPCRRLPCGRCSAVRRLPCRHRRRSTVRRLPGWALLGGGLLGHGLGSTVRRLPVSRRACLGLRRLLSCRGLLGSRLLECRANHAHACRVPRCLHHGGWAQSDRGAPCVAAGAGAAGVSAPSTHC
jgi:hypothetical protein